MKRFLLTTSFSLVLALALAEKAFAERLEIGLAAGPTFVMDKNYEAFSNGNLALAAFGLDIRSQVGSAGGFQFAPLVSYRFGADSGTMYNALDTELFTHDFKLGLRVRKDVLSWLALFVEAYGGVLLGSMTGTLSTDGSYTTDDYYSGSSNSLLGLQDTYEDRRITWSAGGQIGVETHFSRPWLARRNVHHFCFGGEISVGYLAHGDLKFNPTLSGSDKNAIETQSIGAWGGVNTSGVTLQIAGSLYFI